MPEFVQRQNRTQSSRLVSPAKPDRAVPRPGFAENPLLAEQQALGNQAMQHLLGTGIIQAKLKIGQPGDKYEQEADRVAEQVMRMPEPAVSGKEAVSGQEHGTRINRMCSECEEELQRQPLEEEEEEEILQAKSIPGRIPEVTPDIEARIDALRGGGQPLSESDRAFFEGRFRYDFSQVRIHIDRKAVASAQEMNALAYTVGQHIVFAAGQYAPGTSTGRRLLGHELTHVLQQRVLHKTVSQEQYETGQTLRGPMRSSVPRILETGMDAASQPVQFRKATDEEIQIWKASAPLVWDALLLVENAGDAVAAYRDTGLNTVDALEENMNKLVQLYNIAYLQHMAVLIAAGRIATSQDTADIVLSVFTAIVVGLTLGAVFETVVVSRLLKSVGTVGKLGAKATGEAVTEGGEIVVGKLLKGASSKATSNPEVATPVDMKLSYYQTLADLYRKLVVISQELSSIDKAKLEGTLLKEGIGAYTTGGESSIPIEVLGDRADAFILSASVARDLPFAAAAAAERLTQLAGTFTQAVAEPEDLIVRRMEQELWILWIGSADYRFVENRAIFNRLINIGLIGDRDASLLGIDPDLFEAQQSPGDAIRRHSKERAQLLALVGKEGSVAFASPYGVLVDGGFYEAVPSQPVSPGTPVWVIGLTSVPAKPDYYFRGPVFKKSVLLVEPIEAATSDETARETTNMSVSQL